MQQCSAYCHTSTRIYTFMHQALVLVSCCASKQQPRMHNPQVSSHRTSKHSPLHYSRSMQQPPISATQKECLSVSPSNAAAASSDKIGHQVCHIWSTTNSHTSTSHEASIGNHWTLYLPLCLAAALCHCVTPFQHQQTASSCK